MKNLKFAIISMSVSALAWSCQSGPSETDNAYAEIVSMTDSIQMMNNNLKDSLQMAMNMNQKMMGAMDTMANKDSSMMANMAQHQIVFQEQKASIDKIDAMISDFENFETEHDKGEMKEADVKAQVDQIKEEQKDILDQQDHIKNELDKIQNDNKDAMQKMNDKSANDNNADMDQTKMGKK